jgi:hypothetical protein
MKMKYSKETEKLKKQILALHKIGEQIGGRGSISIFIRSFEEQEMMNEIAPDMNLERDEVDPTCWKNVDTSKCWFYFFDYRQPK